MPDYFQGDPITDDVMSKPDSVRNSIMGDWLKKHSIETAWPVVRDVIAILKERGITTFGAVGFCYGGSFEHWPSVF